MKELGVKIEQKENLFEPDEGSIDLIYGRIGSGKTAKATRMILEDLAAGKSVYCNWHLDLTDFKFDDREKFWRSFLNFLLFHEKFYVFNKENLHYFDSAEVSTEWLSNLTDCNVYIDEGQWIFDSYEGTKFSQAKRKLILHTRHLNRRIVIITQRPTAIQVSARGNVNRFFKCTNMFRWPILVLKVQEFQDMSGETVDETVPVRTEWNLMSKRILNAYNTKYLRGGVPRSQKLFYEVYVLGFFDRLRAIFRSVVLYLRSFWLKPKRTIPPAEPSAENLPF